MRGDPFAATFTTASPDRPRPACAHLLAISNGIGANLGKPCWLGSAVVVKFSAAASLRNNGVRLVSMANRLAFAEALPRVPSFVGAPGEGSPSPGPEAGPFRRDGYPLPAAACGRRTDDAIPCILKPRPAIPTSVVQPSEFPWNPSTPPPSSACAAATRS